MTDTTLLPVTEALLPCPFCGSQTLPHYVSGGPGNHYVKCTCGVMTDDGSRERARRIWNTRHRISATPTDAVRALEEEVVWLREALGRLRDLPIEENDDPNTLHLNGEVYRGPVVDWTFSIIRKVKEIARAALATEEA